MRDSSSFESTSAPASTSSYDGHARLDRFMRVLSRQRDFGMSIECRLMKRGPLCQSYRLDVGIDRQEILQPLVTAGALSLDAMTHLDHTQIPLRHGIVERRPSDSITAVGIRSAFVQNLQRCACAAILCFETRRHLCGFDVPIERRHMKRRLIAPVGPQRHIDAKPHRFTAEDGRTSRFRQATVSGSWRMSQEKRWSCLCETPAVCSM